MPDLQRAQWRPASGFDIHVIPQVPGPRLYEWLGVKEETGRVDVCPPTPPASPPPITVAFEPLLNATLNAVTSTMEGFGVTVHTQTGEVTVGTMPAVRTATWATRVGGGSGGSHYYLYHDSARSTGRNTKVQGDDF